jgi:hypothetical protein
MSKPDALVGNAHTPMPRKQFGRRTFLSCIGTGAKGERDEPQAGYNVLPSLASTSGVRAAISGI